MSYTTTMLTVPQAARRARRNPETIRRWIREGKLRARKVGTQHVIEERDLDDLLQEASLPVPSTWERLWNGDPMPDWVTIIRRDRESH
jgi:excisionase family DNA binding protein